MQRRKARKDQRADGEREESNKTEEERRSHAGEPWAARTVNGRGFHSLMVRWREAQPNRWRFARRAHLLAPASLSRAKSCPRPTACARCRRRAPAPAPVVYWSVHDAQMRAPGVSTDRRGRAQEREDRVLLQPCARAACRSAREPVGDRRVAGLGEEIRGRSWRRSYVQRRVPIACCCS